MRIAIIPRWGGTAANDFYPWLVRTLQADHADVVDEVAIVAMPNPQTPELGPWVEAARGAIGDAALAARSVLVGHSVGFQAVMRALAELEDGVVVAAAVGIAPWFEIDAPWPSIRPWIETPFDHARARTAARRIDALLSDDDPFTRDHARTSDLLQARLGARVRLVAGGRHFNGESEPEVLRELLAVVGDGAVER